MKRAVTTDDLPNAKVVNTPAELEAVLAQCEVEPAPGGGSQFVTAGGFGRCRSTIKAVLVDSDKVYALPESAGFAHSGHVVTELVRRPKARPRYPFQYSEVHAEDGVKSKVALARSGVAKKLEELASQIRSSNKPVSIDLKICAPDQLLAIYLVGECPGEIEEERPVLFTLYIRRASDQGAETTVPIHSVPCYGVLEGMFMRCTDRENFYVDFSEGVEAGAIEKAFALGKDCELLQGISTELAR